MLIQQQCLRISWRKTENLYKHVNGFMVRIIFIAIAATKTCVPQKQATVYALKFYPIFDLRVSNSFFFSSSASFSHFHLTLFGWKKRVICGKKCFPFLSFVSGIIFIFFFEFFLVFPLLFLFRKVNKKKAVEIRLKENMVFPKMESNIYDS